MASLLWTLVLLMLLFYSFGVLFTQMVSDECRWRTVLSDSARACLRLEANSETPRHGRHECCAKSLGKASEEPFSA